MEMKLADYGYPEEGIVYVETGGGNCIEVPQETYSPYTCKSCRRFNGDCCTKNWNNADESYYCPSTDDKDPDTDTCDDIDYEEEFLGGEYGFRSPVRCEYSSDETYNQACEAIKVINERIRFESSWGDDF